MQGAGADTMGGAGAAADRPPEAGADVAEVPEGVTTDAPTLERAVFCPRSPRDIQCCSHTGQDIPGRILKKAFFVKMNFKEFLFFFPESIEQNGIFGELPKLLRGPPIKISPVWWIGLNWKS